MWPCLSCSLGAACSSGSTLETLQDMPGGRGANPKLKIVNGPMGPNVILVWPCGDLWGSVYESHSDTSPPSSHPSRLVGSRQAISGSDRIPSEPCFGTTGPDGARQMARLPHIDTRLMYMEPYGNLPRPRRLSGPYWDPMGPGGPPAEPA